MSELFFGAVGSVLGISGQRAYHYWIKPLREASSNAGIPLREINFRKAIDLGKHTRSWKSFSDRFWYESSLNADIPEDVNGVLMGKLTMNGIPITIDFVGAESTPLVEIWTAKRTRVREFYQDPIVQAYLRKSSAKTAQLAPDSEVKTPSQEPIRKLDDLMFQSI